MASVQRNAAWSPDEVEATVGDYFQMLYLELAGQAYNKASHRRALQERLQRRSEPAIELKHCNISAILIELGCPWIDGYKPRGNYQQLLFDVVSARVNADATFDRIALDAVQRPAVLPAGEPLLDVFEEAPTIRMGDVGSSPGARMSAPAKRDYLAREAANMALGRAGEEFVVLVERHRLIRSGKAGLADRVENVADTRGDGLGYDVLSYEASGAPRFIEVKTTSFGKETPFFLSKGELEFSRTNAETFQLYRLFNFRKTPRLFALPGAVDSHCRLDPATFVARFS